jgi:hypothetical protein
MKKSVSAIVILLAVLSFGGTKWKTYVGYDKNVNFDELKTFAYFETLETSVADSAPPVHEMIKLLIIIQLQKGGHTLVEKDQNPDFFVTYHTSQNEAMGVNVTMYHYHYGAGWWWSPLWGSGMDISSYTRGTLVVDMWKPDTEEIIWRGAVMGVIPDDPSPAKAQKTIEKALNKLGQEYRKQRSKNK